MKTTTVHEIKVTLPVDLVWTDLEDFAASFSYEGEVSPWVSSHWLWGDIGNRRITWHSGDSDVELPYGTGEASQDALSIDVWRADLAANRILFTADSPKDGYPGAGKTHFTLWIIQYRRDRLKLVLEEHYEVRYEVQDKDFDDGDLASLEGEERMVALERRLRRWLHWEDRKLTRLPQAEAQTAVYAPRLLKWLTDRWGGIGDGVFKRTSESASVMVMPSASPGRPMSACSVWAVEQFESGRPLADISAEFAERYNAEKPENATLPDKALRDLFWRWKRTKANKG